MGLSCKFSLKPIHWIKVQWWYIWSDLIVMNPALLCDMLRSKCQQRAEARIPGCHIWNEAGSQQKYTQKKCQKVGILIFFTQEKSCAADALMYPSCSSGVPDGIFPWTITRERPECYPNFIPVFPRNHDLLVYQWYLVTSESYPQSYLIYIRF